MSLTKLKEVIGEELFKSVEEKLKEANKEYFFAEGKEFIPISKFNEINELNKQLTNQVKERDNQLVELQKKVKGNEELTKQIAELQETNKKTQENYQAEVLRIKKDTTLKLKLSESGAKNTDALLGILQKDLNNMEFKDDQFVGIDEKIAQIKKDNAWLFSSNVPQNMGEGHSNSIDSGSDEFSKIRKL